MSTQGRSQVRIPQRDARREIQVFTQGRSQARIPQRDVRRVV